jgi:signal transduction histidine kinase
MIRPVTPRGTRSLRPTSSYGPAVHAWRLSTAVRVFGLALAAGEVAAADAWRADGLFLGVWGVIAASCCVLERPRAASPARWVPGAEAVLLVSLIAFVPGRADLVAVCVAIPVLVAGLRSGAVASVLVAVAATVVLGSGLAGPTALVGVGPVLLWLFVGLGGGLLAAAQTRSNRRQASDNAPYVAARNLVDQLQALARRDDVDLTASAVCSSLQDELADVLRVSGSEVWVLSPAHDLELLAARGDALADGPDLARSCVRERTSLASGRVVAIPLRADDQVFGSVVLRAARQISDGRAAELQDLVDTHAVRLETALLVDGLWSHATAEERQRLARELHDGVAQRVVALGYLADDLAAASDDPQLLAVAESLRGEVGGISAELRTSVLDLRRDVDGADNLSTALTSCVRTLGSRSALRVHLVLDERGPRLPRAVEWEVLRIAQEAIANVRQHAQAVNLWVSLATDGRQVSLAIEDDGTGAVEPRPGHCGLQTMRERAERIGADLSIVRRPDGGTRVLLASRAVRGSNDLTTEESRDDQRVAR